MDEQRGLRSSSGWLAVRSIAWTVLLPGIVAGYVPWRFFGLEDVRVNPRNPVQFLGLACIGIGAVFLGTCIREFAASGRGTLSPVDPPTELVVRGLYRYVRNPMYLSVATLLTGEAVLVQSWPLLMYLIVWFLLVHLFVFGYEEPTLRRTFGASYQQYCASVGRWLPRVSRKR